MDRQINRDKEMILQELQVMHGLRDVIRGGINTQKDGRVDGWMPQIGRSVGGSSDRQMDQGEEKSMALNICTKTEGYAKVS